MIAYIGYYFLSLTIMAMERLRQIHEDSQKGIIDLEELTPDTMKQLKKEVASVSKDPIQKQEARKMLHDIYNNTQQEAQSSIASLRNQLENPDTLEEGISTNGNLNSPLFGKNLETIDVSVSQAHTLASETL